MIPIKGKLDCKKCSPNKGHNKNRYKLNKAFFAGHETRKDFRHRLKDFEKPV